MQCTKEQIEEKRRQAMLKLQAKYKNNGSNLTSNSTATSTTPQKQLATSSYGGTTPVRPGTSPYRQSKPYDRTFPSKSSDSPSKYNFKLTDKAKPVLPFYGKSEVVTGTCNLISEDRFEVVLSGFSTPALEVFKTIPTKHYNLQTRIWDFHLKDYELLIGKLQTLQPTVVCGKLPNFVLNACRMKKMDYNEIDLSCIDPELSSALMSFQTEGVCFGIDKKGRCLIADEMGLGKTFQALAIANYYKNDWPLLVVTTASMKNSWEETIHKYLPTVSIMEIQYMTSGKDYIGDAKILIVSHDMMSRSLDKLLDRNFGVMIVDESHTIKNFKTKCTKSATALAKKAKRVILLSGTPALSRPSELFTQLSLIDEKFFGNFFDYSKRYCDGKTTQFGWDASGKSNLPELEIILAKKFMIRRTKGDVLKSLPNKVQEVVTLDVKLDQFSKEDRRCLNALAEKYNKGKKLEKHTLLLTFFAETAKIKIPSVCSYILQTLETSEKFLVFAHHQKMLDAIQKVMQSKNKKFIRIDGTTSSEQRKHFVDKFQYDDSCICAILSITAANAGITLTSAQLIIFAELHWNPSILSQAESRAHRIGQQGQVRVKYLLAPGTSDDSIWPLLREKQKILGEIGLTKDSYDRISITKQDATKTEVIAECLQSNITGYNTLDISSYFESPEKKEEGGLSANVSAEEMDFFNDDFDDALSKIDV